MAVSSAAGALNICATLPLEVVTTRLQTVRLRARQAEAPTVPTLSKGSVGSSMAAEARAVLAADGVSGLWRGLVPSLILTSNPAVQFASFDVLKRAWLGKDNHRKDASLGAGEAFLLGAASKALAIAVTYPLIRAKVILQARDKATAGGAEAAATPPGLALLLVLRDIMTNEGIAGFYKGMGAQMGKTVLGAAITMSTKERIAVWLASAVAALTKR